MLGYTRGRHRRGLCRGTGSHRCGRRRR
jgi:hypothetical protein